jgi:hypothetical protein
MRRVFLIVLPLCIFFSSCASEMSPSVRRLAVATGVVALEHAAAPRAENASAESVQAIDRACIKPAITGNEATVVIRSVRGAQYYPVRDKLILALQRAGYTVLETDSGSASGRGNFASSGQNLSDFLKSVYGNSPGLEDGRTSSPAGNLPKADYYLEETTTWISGERNFSNIGGSAFGYYGNYAKRSSEGELRISIVLFDGENRAVPGKISEATVRLVLRGSWESTFITYYFGDFSGNLRELQDPATEATLRMIPKMFADNGAR